jgi:hypothetical protein
LSQHFVVQDRQVLLLDTYRAKSITGTAPASHKSGKHTEETNPNSGE